MYAVIKTGGKQYRVQPGDLLVVEKLEGDVGAAVSFDQVLMLGGDGGPEGRGGRHGGVRNDGQQGQGGEQTGSVGNFHFSRSLISALKTIRTFPSSVTCFWAWS